ncbi:MAG: KH domain-containing protein [Bacteroidota bacterium]
MEAIAKTILGALVTNQDAVRIDCGEEEGNRLKITIQVDPADVGKVIGKQGRTINAIRVVMKAAASKRQQQVNVELLT